MLCTCLHVAGLLFAVQTVSYMHAMARFRTHVLRMYGTEDLIKHPIKLGSYTACIPHSKGNKSTCTPRHAFCAHTPRRYGADAQSYGVAVGLLNRPSCEEAVRQVGARAGHQELGRVQGSRV
jgi:hypothetical protein